MLNDSHPEIPLTVRDVLRLPAMRRGRPECVAGASGLDSRIRWVHATEVSNIADLLTGGELLLTTGIGVGQTSAQQRRFIADISARGVAAVVLELGQIHQEPPTALVDSAQAHGLPLIVLRREVRFVEITEATHRAIVGHQLAVLRRGEEIHRRFTTLLLDGAGIPEVLAGLSETLANPVVIERDGEILFHATHRADDAHALAAWDTGVERFAIPVPSGTQEASVQLIVLGLDSPIDDDTRVAAERAAGVIAFSLLRDREADRLALRQAGSFLDALAKGELAGADAVVYADALRFHHDPGRLIPLAFAPAVGMAAPVRAAWPAFCRAVSEETAARKLPALTGPAGNGRYALAVVATSARSQREKTVGQVVGAARAAAIAQLGNPDAVVISAGARCDDWESLGRALAEVAEAVLLAVHEPPRDWHDASTPRLRHLLWRLRESPELTDFSSRRLAPLLDHGDSSPLLLTLEALCANGWRKADAARTLHIERQSLYHRIHRIERLLGSSLDDPETRTALHLAIIVRQLP